MTKEREYIGSHRTFSIVTKVVWIFVLILAILALAKACLLCNYRASIVDKTGYLPDNDDWDNIPDVRPPYDDKDSLNLPECVLLEKFFPPIGDQGSKGTCVAWAVGYNLKTALNAIEKHWDASALALTENQTSPKDLWLCIPLRERGANCSGTGFESAFEALKYTGASSMAVVPYRDLQGCTGVGKGDFNNRIASYHRVSNDGSIGSIPEVSQIKSYINDTIPLVVGAHLGDRFMRWNSDKVISHDSYNFSGMHAYHAMVLVGYDDGRHAFRLRNSWGKDWGDDGSIWVDYNFFRDEFCFVVMIADNLKSGQSS